MEVALSFDNLLNVTEILQLGVCSFCCGLSEVDFIFENELVLFHLGEITSGEMLVITVHHSEVDVSADEDASILEIILSNHYTTSSEFGCSPLRILGF